MKIKLIISYFFTNTNKETPSIISQLIKKIQMMNLVV